MNDQTQLKALVGFGFFAIVFVITLSDSAAVTLVGTVAGALLAGAVVHRRLRTAIEAAAEAREEAAAGEELATTESEVEPEPDTATGGSTDLDASRSEPPSPSDADTAVSAIAPGMAATDEATQPETEDADPVPSERSDVAVKREDGTADAHTASDSPDSASETPADDSDGFEESVSEGLASEAQAERIDAVETVASKAGAGGFDSERAVDALARHLETETVSEVRVATVEALGSIGTERAISLLEEHRLDTDTAVSKAASSALRNRD